MKKLKGKAWKFGDDISTDHIAPGRLFHLRTNLPELAKHVLEDADPDFAKKLSAGDIVVGGRNFGLGSSREHAPQIIKIAGLSAVLAKSFARIFYRNSINLGLPVLICDTDKIASGDELEIDMNAGEVNNITKDVKIIFQPLPSAMLRILADGGIINHFQKNKGFKLT